MLVEEKLSAMLVVTLSWYIPFPLGAEQFSGPLFFLVSGSIGQNGQLCDQV